MDISEHGLSVIMFDMSVLKLTEFIVIPVSSFIPQNLFHLTVISLCNY